MKTAFVLSSGGVLGAAHIGVLEELDRVGIKPDLLVATSAGAILGSLYAAGGTLLVNDFLERLVEENSGPKGYIFNTPKKFFDKVRHTLKEYLPSSWEDLNLPFYVVATNIKSGESIVMSSGKLVDSIMASASFPGLFPPQTINGVTCIDGGLTANLPSRIAKDLGAKRIIGSSVYTLPNITIKNKRQIKAVSAIGRALDILQFSQVHEQEKLCDYCFKPPKIEHYAAYNLNSLKELRDVGRSYAKDQIKELLEIL